MSECSKGFVSSGMKSSAFVIAIVMLLCTLHVQSMAQLSQHPMAPVTRSLQPDSNEQAFIDALNAVRENPSSFLPAIDRYERYVRSFRPNQKALNKALKEIRARLKKEKPLAFLYVAPALQQAATDHVEDMAKSGLTGHIGGDGSNPGTRVQRYGSFPLIGECITIGYLTAELQLASMLVDESTPDRGHRENLLRPGYKYLGVGIAEHPSLRLATVLVLGG